MTEAEWLTTTDTRAMLRFLGSRASARKLRLFACASARLFAAVTRPPSLAEPESATILRGVERAELLADGWRPAGPTDQPVYRLTVLIPEARQAARLTMTDLCWGKWLPHSTRADLFRDVFGNPFWFARRARCPECDGKAGLWAERSRALPEAECVRCRGSGARQGPPDSLTPAVRQLAQAIYADRAFADLPVLADALEEAGCADDVILAHCRGPGPHARGCWVVDLVLGKD